MGDVSFELNLWALFLALAFGALCLFAWRIGKSRAGPKIFFSNLKDLASGWKSRLANLPFYFFSASIIFFLIAFVDVRLALPREDELKEQISERLIPREGIAIYLALDHSGSMAQEVRARTASGRLETLSKLSLLKRVTREFITGDPSIGLRGRPNDMIGLVVFARGANVLAPLTLDHEAVLKKLEQIDLIRDREQDGTAIGYALYKTANLIAATRHYGQELEKKGKPAYEIKNSVIVLVTDGFQDPNPLDEGKRLRTMELLDAGAFAREKNVRIYIVNVEPKIASETYAAHRSIMRQVAEMTGGKFYLVDSTMDLEKIYQDIDRLEKSELPEELIAKIPKSMLPNLFRSISFYPYLIALGMGSLLIAILLSTLWLRRVP